MNWSSTDHQFMARALQLARRGLYTTTPNPRVGCVISVQDRIVGEGWHRVPGGPHAEIEALERAGSLANGADCYVTLEPCSHTGRTPPCVDALIEAQVNRVVVGMEDPNPLVHGAGIARLTAAGIETSVGLLADGAASLNPGFIMRMINGRPWVSCKMAISLDGRTAAADRGSKWITGTGARLDVQRLRARSCALMTGIGTVLRDDPQLDVRLDGADSRQPLRVVVDRKLRLPAGAAMLARPGRTIVATTVDEPARGADLKAAGAEIWVLDDDPRFLHKLLARLATAEHINELLLEAGADLAGAMLEAGLVDEIILYQAPVILGDRGRPLFTLPGVGNMGDRIPLRCIETRRIGVDLKMVFRTAVDRE